MKLMFAMSLSAAIVLPGVLFAEEAKDVKPAAQVESGLEPGSYAAPFIVRDITGPAKGESLCYFCRYGGRPVVSIFARDVDKNLTSLVKQVDKQIEKNKDKQLSAFVVLLTDDPDSDGPKLKALAEKARVKNVPLTLFDGQTGPEEYKIAKDAQLNVMMWVGGQVKVNEAFAKAKLAKKQLASLDKATGKILE